MKAVTATHIFNGNQLVNDQIIILQDRTIVDIISHEKFKDNNHYNKLPIMNYGHGVISRGFVDLQLNGCGGVSFNNDLNTQTLEIMYQTCLRFGTTQFLPTIITAPWEDIIQALEIVKKWYTLYGNTRGVLGLHIEGPFISTLKSGIHPKNYILKPEMKYLAQIATYSRFFPIKMTIASENFTPDQINYLIENKIILAIGHSNASYQELINYIPHQITLATHTFNAMSGLSAREPGVIGTILNTNLYAGLVADLIHVAPSNIEIMYKLKPNHTYLVTDAVTPTGTTMTEFNFAHKHLYVKDGKCVDAEGTIGGAYLTLNQAIKNCITSCNIPIENALKMAINNPLKALGINNLLLNTKQDCLLNFLSFEDYQCTIINPQN